MLLLFFSIKGFISKTLDSVSAQFAASALVTSEQLMGFKMKDDVVLGIGVNGILQASGKKQYEEKNNKGFAFSVGNGCILELRLIVPLIPQEYTRAYTSVLLRLQHLCIQARHQQQVQPCYSLQI